MPGAIRLLLTKYPSEWFFLWMLLLWLLTVASGTAPVVVTPFGKIRGAERTAPNQRTYLACQGIPYAKPPLGELRFARPVAHPKIDGVFDATGDMKLCPQPDSLDFGNADGGQEDCLVLGVFTKDLPKSSSIKKKVIVFIHGGGFVLGGEQNWRIGNFVTEQGIIFVALHYRLGILGFLSTENEASQGNYGLWDQTLAIKWVKDNIAAFGGDASDITVSGESAGSAAVSLLSISPATKGLFSKAFAMSGAATSYFANIKDPQFETLALAKVCNCWDGKTDEKVDLEASNAIVKCMRNIPLSVLTKYPNFAFARGKFAPSVDGDFIPQPTSQLVVNKDYLKSVGFFERSYLVGLDNNERSVLELAVKILSITFDKAPDLSEETKASIISSLIHTGKTSVLSLRQDADKHVDALLDKVMAWYDRRFGSSSTVELLSDLSFLIPTYEFINAMAGDKSTDVYVFYFNHYPAYMKGDLRGIVHGVDLAYWFDVEVNDLEKLLHAGLNGQFDAEDSELKARFSSLIGEFVKTGNPGTAMKSKLSSGWPKYDRQGSHYLDFEPNPTIKTHLEAAKRDFWLTTFPAWVAELQKQPDHTEL